ncbi:DnaJ-domain-containing protein [Coniophora puteana RWD-64-598 SS2]|uniref:DnaJ-domain-containing protein n=1 Tax=Coniophora puteana (strain RWD-64-598) TaxID=741705 RepID=A0A5M3MIZ3_CONPW|nr:DnaJ-domain-containing protein [Coniophora puteana RWD-64-598 SS2]EIW79229.1 DnaJ-domain-containing protein [Coniophora puteana RWD-64-598 SS2]
MIGLTLYDVLGLTPTATTDDVRKAYKMKARETHPDKLTPNASDRERRAAEGKFRNVYDAFQVLSDPVKRRAYDGRIQAATNNANRWDAERERIKQEREEWARQAKERSEARLKQRADLASSIRDMKDEKAVYNEVVDKIYQELVDSSPEWAIRKKEVLQRKAIAEKNASTRALPRRQTTL